ncbi:hypothetical protein MKW92_029734 [Papaver armeniacum]|nr:hypothetical protein MKW92_029734 [Papaver armeniacum]
MINPCLNFNIELLSNVFTWLQIRYRDEYRLCNLSCFTVFQEWNPLQNVHWLQLVASWKNLFQGDDPFDFSDDVSPYTQLVMEVVFPAIRSCCTNTWDPRDPEPMLRLLEALLLPSVLRSVLDNLIVPKLPCGDMGSTKEDGCNPCLGASMATTVGTDIRFKLGKVLHAWHPSDPSAYDILSPWKTVLDSDSWERLVSQFIEAPKLEEALLKFQVWQQVLHLWMCSNPDFEEITQWYVGWKEIFAAEAAELLANDWIRHQLDIGLDMMNQAVEGMEVTQLGVRDNISHLRVTEQRQIGVHADCMNEVPEMSLKEILGLHAQSMSCCLNQSLAGHIMWGICSRGAECQGCVVF